MKSSGITSRIICSDEYQQTILSYSKDMRLFRIEYGEAAHEKRQTTKRNRR